MDIAQGFTQIDLRLAVVRISKGCNGRSNIDYRERLELEYYYVKNCSLYLDALCILRTALAVIKKDGAQ